MPYYLLFPGIHGNVRRKEGNWISFETFQIALAKWSPDRLDHIILSRKVDAVSIHLLKTALAAKPVLVAYLDREKDDGEDHQRSFSAVLRTVTPLYCTPSRVSGEFEIFECSFEKFEVTSSSSSGAVTPPDGNIGWLGHLNKAIISTHRSQTGAASTGGARGAKRKDK